MAKLVQKISVGRKIRPSRNFRPRRSFRPAPKSRPRRTVCPCPTFRPGRKFRPDRKLSPGRKSSMGRKLRTGQICGFGQKFPSHGKFRPGAACSWSLSTQAWLWSKSPNPKATRDAFHVTLPRAFLLHVLPDRGYQLTVSRRHMASANPRRRLAQSSANPRRRAKNSVSPARLAATPIQAFPASDCY